LAVPADPRRKKAAISARLGAASAEQFRKLVLYSIDRIESKLSIPARVTVAPACRHSVSQLGQHID
jgi:hypothetical protein